MNRFVLYSHDGKIRGSFHHKWHAYEAAKRVGLRKGEFIVVDTWEKKGAKGIFDKT